MFRSSIGYTQPQKKSRQSFLIGSIIALVAAFLVYEASPEVCTFVLEKYVLVCFSFSTHLTHITRLSTLL